MSENLLDAMLHPIRMRIMTTLAGSEGMTPQQLAETMPEVPQATLYRHINRLTESSLLTVIEERQVRGTIEKVYVLNNSVQTHLGREDMQNLSKEEHMHYFNTFLVTLMEEFSIYLRQTKKVDYAADGVGYSQVILYMDDAEMLTFSQKINEAILPYLADTGEGHVNHRKKRILSTVLLPAANVANMK